MVQWCGGLFWLLRTLGMGLNSLGSHHQIKRFRVQLDLRDHLIQCLHFPDWEATVRKGNRHLKKKTTLTLYQALC